MSKEKIKEWKNKIKGHKKKRDNLEEDELQQQATDVSNTALADAVQLPSTKSEDQEGTVPPTKPGPLLRKTDSSVILSGFRPAHGDESASPRRALSVSAASAEEPSPNPLAYSSSTNKTHKLSKVITSLSFAKFPRSVQKKKKKPSSNTPSPSHLEKKKQKKRVVSTTYTYEEVAGGAGTSGLDPLSDLNNKHTKDKEREQREREKEEKKRRRWSAMVGDIPSMLTKSTSMIFSHHSAGASFSQSAPNLLANGATTPGSQNHLLASSGLLASSRSIPEEEENKN